LMTSHDSMIATQGREQVLDFCIKKFHFPLGRKYPETLEAFERFCRIVVILYCHHALSS